MTDKEEFDLWYERFYLQSPSLCALQYDDEKMWEAWKIAYKIGLAKGAELLEDEKKSQLNSKPTEKSRKHKIEIFTIPKEKHIHTMNKDKE